MPPLDLSDIAMISSDRQLEILSDLFRNFFGRPPTTRTALKGDASSRCLYRLQSGEQSAIGVYGPNRNENRAFLSFTKTFLQLGLPVPKLFLETENGFAYLLEDLGDETLFHKLIQARNAHDGSFPFVAVQNDYESAIATLVEFQMKAGQAIDRSLCYQGDVFDDAAWKRDHIYFLDKFAELFSPAFSERCEVEDELAEHRKLLSEFPCDRFLYRDFQSRNMMVTTNGLRFLDYQSGRIGYVAYDIASLLYDARADLPDGFRRTLFSEYVRLLLPYGYSHSQLSSAFAPFALLRILQALGSYGNNGICNGHREYLTAIPFGLRNALSVIDNDLQLKPRTHVLRDLLQRLSEERNWEHFEGNTTNG